MLLAGQVLDVRTSEREILSQSSSTHIRCSFFSRRRFEQIFFSRLLHGLQKHDNEMKWIIRREIIFESKNQVVVKRMELMVIVCVCWYCCYMV